jgi:hypothetical protein
MTYLCVSLQLSNLIFSSLNAMDIVYNTEYTSNNILRQFSLKNIKFIATKNCQRNLIENKYTVTPNQYVERKIVKKVYFT